MTTDSYMGYSDRLLRLAETINIEPWHVSRRDVQSALNGQAAEQLRALVPRAVRRAEGAFFTGSKVRSRFERLLQESPRFWDPACGAGDLLLAAAGTLPLRDNLRSTLDQWGTSLYGGDLQPSFVQVAKIRLFLLAAARHKERGDEVNIDARTGSSLFRHVRVANAHAELDKRRSYNGTIVLNPPFGSIRAPLTCDWATGAVSQAALMALNSVSKLAIGQQFVAILPDVLRSGSRYARWRSSLEAILDLERIEVFGQFDDQTDVDVFLLSGRRRRRTGSATPVTSLWWPHESTALTVGDRFNVGVGTVVDNRDPHSGPSVPFLVARDLREFAQIGEPGRLRNFSGRLFTPPFVAVRRTSRPGLRAGGAARAAGTLVVGGQAIAVDNHIIAVESRNGSLEECIQLIEVLNSSETSMWLDERIRCRHLTVGVIRSVPWSSR